MSIKIGDQIYYRDEWEPYLNGVSWTDFVNEVIDVYHWSTDNTPLRGNETADEVAAFQHKQWVQDAYKVSNIECVMVIDLIRIIDVLPEVVLDDGKDIMLAFQPINASLPVTLPDPFKPCADRMQMIDFTGLGFGAK